MLRSQWFCPLCECEADVTECKVNCCIVFELVPSDRLAGSKGLQKCDCTPLSQMPTVTTSGPLTIGFSYNTACRSRRLWRDLLLIGVSFGCVKISDHYKEVMGCFVVSCTIACQFCFCDRLNENGISPN